MAKTFNDAVKSYLTTGRSTRYIDKVAAYFGDRPLSEIVPYDVYEMAKELYPTQSNATKNRLALTPLNAVMYHAYERGWCSSLRLRRFKEARPKQKVPANALWMICSCVSARKTACHT